MKNRKEIVFECPGDSFAEASQRDDLLANQRVDGRFDRAKEERACQSNPFEPLLRLCALPLPLCELRLRLWLLRLAVEPLGRREPLPERVDPLRDVRAFAPAELARALLFEGDPFDDPALLLDRELLDDLLLLCLLPEDLLVAATAHPSSSRTLLQDQYP